MHGSATTSTTTTSTSGYWLKYNNNVNNYELEMLPVELPDSFPSALSLPNWKMDAISEYLRLNTTIYSNLVAPEDTRFGG